MKQLSFKKVNGWGGSRRRAGRKNRSGLVSHGKREEFDLRTPLHLTLKLKKNVACLRSPVLLKEFRQALQWAKRCGLAVVHYSLLDDHLHLFVEAESSRQLARGMKSFGSRFGKAIRRIVGGRGSVFAGRFHMHVLKTPTEVKRALAYVLTNFAKHAKLIAHIDDFSSGTAFKEWRKLVGKAWNRLLEEHCKLNYVPRPELTEARSWLARGGWMRAMAA